MPPSTFWKALKRLEKAGTVQLENIENGNRGGNRRGTLVTLCNWDTYQDHESNGEQEREQGGNRAGTGGEQGGNTREERKKERRGEGKTRSQSPYSEDFEAFWVAYPSLRKGKKGEAWKAWQKALKEGANPAVLIAKAREFAASNVGRGKYCPGPAPWLNQRRWEDDPRSWERLDEDQDPRGNLSLLQRRAATAGTSELF